MQEELPPTKTLLYRGWRRRCPQCGQGLLFRHWFKIRENCSHCGLKYLENEGDVFGFVVLADRIFFLIPLVVIFFFIPFAEHSIWRWVWGIGLLFLLVYTFPHRLGVGLAIDYLIRRKNEMGRRLMQKG